MTEDEKREKHRLYMQEYRKKKPTQPLTGEALQRQRDQQREYQRKRRASEQGRAALKAAKQRYYEKMMSTEEGRQKLLEQKGPPRTPTERQRERNRYRGRERMARLRSDPDFRAREAAQLAEYRKTESARAAWRRYMKKMRKTPEGILLIAARKRLNLLVKQKGAYKAGTTRDLVGCTVPQLKAHIEAQFRDGMTWENYGRGGWHVDHIRPCSSFDLADPEQVRQCFHYTNLQPLWETENLQKSDSWDEAA